MSKRKLIGKLATVLLGCCLALTPLGGCAPDSPKQNEQPTSMLRGMNAYDFTKASFSATDRVGREITPMHKKLTDHDRYVGVFYFLWLGTHETSMGVYDVTKLQTTQAGADAVLSPSHRLGEKIPGTVNAELGYPDGMESPTMYVHWTNEPLFGYYNTADEWVITRHLEMLTMADVDFIFLDTTNNYDYAENVNTNYRKDEKDPKNVQLGRPTYVLLDTVLKMQEQGWDVPKVVFYTNTRSGELVDKIYTDFYADGKYDECWFMPFGKPMLVGVTEDNKGTNMSGDSRVNISDEMRDYFDVRESQWPYMKPADDGFPWMDWSKGYNHYYPDNRAVNVNVAQHGDSETSYSAYTNYGKAADRRSSRGYVEAENRIDENWEAGQNIEDQWESVWHYQDEGKSVEMVTVTGWNEWLAWKYYDGNNILFIDNFNNQFSRDMEPDKNYYQDNFYMQLVRNVRKYKYGEAKSNYEWDKQTVRGTADAKSMKAVYKDFEGDAIERDFYGFDIRPEAKAQGLIGAWYQDDSNRNDIVETRVAHDNENAYFYVRTKENITAYEGGENWMNVLIKTKNSTKEGSWEEYDYIINRKPEIEKNAESGLTSVEKSSGGWKWTETSKANLTVSGNEMFIVVPLAALGLSANSVSFEFKVADNVTDYTDIMDYYVTGDSAPIGRLRYAYGY